MFKDLIPWKKKKNQKELNIYRDFDNPFLELHKSMNDLFDNFFEEKDFFFKSPFGLMKKDEWFKTLNVDVVEKDKEILVKADLPGLNEKNIQVNLDGNMLTIKGKKCEEKENKNGKYYLSERRCGNFSRTIPIQQDLIDQDKIKATFKKGVLKLTLPKISGKETTATKQIEIQAED